MTRRIKFTCDTGFAGCRHEEVIELDDDMTQEELEEFSLEWAGNFIEVYWEEAEEEDE